MKVRTDYVTNSSSSSFIIVSKINKSQELLEYMKEEYGKYGLRLLDEYLVKALSMRMNTLLVIIYQVMLQQSLTRMQIIL